MSGLRRLLAVAGLTAAIVASSAAAIGAHAATTQRQSNRVSVHKLGTFNFAKFGGSASTELSPGSTSDPGISPPNPKLRHQYAAGTPLVAPTAITGNTTSGFDGINHLQQRYAGSGTSYQNTQFSLIPSDQGLCVSSGLTTNFVVEPVNDAIRVFGTDGTADTAVVPLNAFFKLSPEINRSTGVYGPSIGDPTCYFDVPTQRWFVSVYMFSVDPTTGAFTTPTKSLVAVSSGSDPTASWTVYGVDTTDATNPNCPCFGDHPVIGADANGFYVAEDEFNFAGSYFKGSQIFAFSKTGLESGTATTAVQIDSAATSGWPYSLPPFLLWPAQSPDASSFDSSANGTEYFLSTLDLSGALLLGTRASAIGVWALTNTASLKTDSPAVTLSFDSLASETYSQPPNAVQKKGPYPLGQGDYNAILGLKVQGAEELVESDEDEMTQAVFADGTLWGATATGVKEPNGATLSGIAWFAVTPSATASGVSATMAGQGYLAAPGQDVMYPSIAASSAGGAVMVFDLAGPDWYPSVAVTTVSPSAGTGTINVVRQGNAPLDTFGGYNVYKYQPGVSRWGDYTAAVADTSGNIWIAGSWVEGNNLCLPTNNGDLSTCAPTDNRSLLANWASWIAKVGS